MAGAVRLAMACNLHIISNPNNLGSFPPSMIPPPKHLLEVCDRINAFWCVYIVDRGASLVSGLPTSIPDEVMAIFGIRRSRLEVLLHIDHHHGISTDSTGFI
jgi:hypothetical protein